MLKKTKIKKKIPFFLNEESNFNEDTSAVDIRHDDEFIFCKIKLKKKVGK